jgi:deoxyhypusine synthase
MRKMSFTSRDTARAADIFNMALEDKSCSPWLILAGSTSRRRLHARLPRHGEATA